MVVKAISFTGKRIEAVYFCIVLVLMETHAGGNQGGMTHDKQLIDLGWPYNNYCTCVQLLCYSRLFATVVCYTGADPGAGQWGTDDPAPLQPEKGDKLQKEMSYYST